MGFLIYVIVVNHFFLREFQFIKYQELFLLFPRQFFSHNLIAFHFIIPKLSSFQRTLINLVIFQTKVHIYKLRTNQIVSLEVKMNAKA